MKKRGRVPEVGTSDLNAHQGEDGVKTRLKSEKGKVPSRSAVSCHVKELEGVGCAKRQEKTQEKRRKDVRDTETVTTPNSKPNEKDEGDEVKQIRNKN